MPLIDRRAYLRTTLAAGACAPFVATGLRDARAADDKTYVMKLGTATINDAQQEWCKQFAAMVEKDSNGRIKGQIYPASQLGPIPREIEGMQFGAIQGYIGPPEFLVGVDARYEVMSTPGLVKDMAHGIRLTGDAELQKAMFGLGANKGVHGVALWVSQPSSIVSREPIRHLADIKGKKLRVLAADMQQEVVRRLGASPITMTLGDVLPAISARGYRRRGAGALRRYGDALLRRRQIHYRDRPAFHLLDGVLEQEMVRLAAQGPADDPRHRCAKGRRRGQQVAGRLLRQVG